MGKGMKELRFSWTEGRLLSLMTTPVVMMIILISIFFIVIITVMMMTWGRLLCICFAHLHRLPLLQNAAAAIIDREYNDNLRRLVSNLQKHTAAGDDDEVLPFMCLYFHFSALWSS